MTEKLNIPKFESETEEAEWWDQHREETAHWLEEAVAAGATSSLSDILQRARERSGGAPTVSVRVDPADTARAFALAARKGVPCETYLRTLLHEALDRDEVSH
jgi:hypothetical protein